MVTSEALQASTGSAVARTTIASHPVEWYAQPARPGYQPSFLGTAVPLPVLPQTLAADVTLLADGSRELRYMHYSVVMSASRRFAYFSAANIDGASLLSLSRTDRDPDHPETSGVAEPRAADVWWFDGRIPAASQVGAGIYDGTDFDFGHLTRRLDPVWGDPSSARVANDDTFHMTNCTPQAHALNTGTWEQLENAVLDAARDHKLKFVVITGPVLDPRDPVIRDVQIPTAYWKVIGYVDGGALVALGFLQWQTDLIGKIGQEARLAELDKAEQWHVPISDIVRLTALDFGPLHDADVKAGAAGEELTADLVDQLAARFATAANA
ncbi:DNA/RNA non-specific endonuclease [Sphingomonas sp. PR090111-T3T-6A]|uniref:DNA/RNA non-specific endonuclease n=1 Tax=Sphingomonas sp. PR090111-T3T-6A TaxID=685778 RepID=UPI00035FD10B|nr:DNA/RNA non-specific endonuclease [Sphingomonas sp. PR090111-T3T-6A]